MHFECGVIATVLVSIALFMHLIGLFHQAAGLQWAGCSFFGVGPMVPCCPSGKYAIANLLFIDLSVLVQKELVNVAL